MLQAIKLLDSLFLQSADAAEVGSYSRKLIDLEIFKVLNDLLQDSNDRVLSQVRSQETTLSCFACMFSSISSASILCPLLLFGIVCLGAECIFVWPLKRHFLQDLFVALLNQLLDCRCLSGATVSRL